MIALAALLLAPAAGCAEPQRTEAPVDVLTLVERLVAARPFSRRKVETLTGVPLREDDLRFGLGRSSGLLEAVIIDAER